MYLHPKKPLANATNCSDIQYSHNKNAHHAAIAAGCAQDVRNPIFMRAKRAVQRAGPTAQPAFKGDPGHGACSPPHPRPLQPAACCAFPAPVKSPAWHPPVPAESRGPYYAAPLHPLPTWGCPIPPSMALTQAPPLPFPPLSALLFYLPASVVMSIMSDIVRVILVLQITSLYFTEQVHHRIN